MLLLAGCAGAADVEDAATKTTPPEDSAPDSQGTAPDGAGSDSTGSGVYANGTYTAEGAYQTPETLEQISVTLTLEDDIVTDVEVTGDPIARQAEQFQGQFIAGIADVVVGVSIDELNVSRVAGSSLTSGGFNAAVDDIKEQAES